MFGDQRLVAAAVAEASRPRPGGDGRGLAARAQRPRRRRRRPRSARRLIAASDPAGDEDVAAGADHQRPVDGALAGPGTRPGSRPAGAVPSPRRARVDAGRSARSREKRWRPASASSPPSSPSPAARRRVDVEAGQGRPAASGRGPEGSVSAQPSRRAKRGAARPPIDPLERPAAAPPRPAPAPRRPRRVLVDVGSVARLRRRRHASPPHLAARYRGAPASPAASFEL